MSAPLAEVPTVRPAPGAQLAEPAERGSLRLEDRVVEKIAAQAVSEVASTMDMPARLLDRLPGRGAKASRVEATVLGHLVQLRVAIAIEYPAAVLPVTRAVREHVRDVVTRLCGVEVRDVDVDVASMRRPEQVRRVQ